MRRLALTLMTIVMQPLSGFAQQLQQPSNFAVVSPPKPARLYGMAGCGLGSVLLPNGPQALTSLINGLAWNQVFVISSGTSNCQSVQQQAGLEQEEFMISNFRSIAREAAQGNGESLAGLADVLGCAPQDQAAFAQLAQKKHQSIFAQPGALAALQSLKNEISSEETLAGSCKYAGLPVGRPQMR